MCCSFSFSGIDLSLAIKSLNPCSPYCAKTSLYCNICTNSWEIIEVSFLTFVMSLFITILPFGQSANPSPPFVFSKTIGGSKPSIPSSCARIFTIPSATACLSLGFCLASSLISAERLWAISVNTLPISLYRWVKVSFNLPLNIRDVTSFSTFCTGSFNPAYGSKLNKSTFTSGTGVSKSDCCHCLRTFSSTTVAGFSFRAFWISASSCAFIPAGVSISPFFEAGSFAKVTS